MILVGKALANWRLALRAFLPWASRLASIFKVKAGNRVRQEAQKEQHFRGAHSQDCAAYGA